MGPNALKYILNVARKSLVKDQGSGIMKVPGRMDAEAKASEIVTELTNAGLDLGKMDDFIKNEGDVVKYLNMLDAVKKERMKPIPADSPRGKEITEQLFGKRGEVVDMKGNVIPEGSGIMAGESIESLMKSGDVTKGTVTKKSKKATDRDMFRAANERFKKTDIDKIIKNINKLDPIEAMKEANKIIKRDSYYKGLSDKDAKRILTETEDHIFQRNVAPMETDVDVGDARKQISKLEKQLGNLDPKAKGFQEKSEELINKIEQLKNPEGDEVTKAYIDAVRKGKFEGTEDQFRDMIDKMMDEDFASGGRVGLMAGGMGRRGFLKLLGGAAATVGAAKSGLLNVIGKGAPKQVVKEVVKTPPVPGKPEWFDSLVNKVILEGDDVTKNFATKDREIVHVKQLGEGEGARVTRDLDDGTIRVEYESPTNLGEEPVIMEYKPGMADETTGGKKPADEFKVVETEPQYVGGPEDADIEFIGENVVNSVDEIVSDTSSLKQFATGKLDPRDLAVRKEKVKKTQAINNDPMEQAEFIENKYGGPIDYEDPMDFASGGLAYLLGE